MAFKSLLNFFPIQRVLVLEDSMLPTIKNGQTCLLLKYIFLKPKVGDIIIFNHSTPPYKFCKRIVKISKNKIWVEGDNKKRSIDSRAFGFIFRKDVLGKIIGAL